MINWEAMPEYCNNGTGRLVREVRCPVCKYRETYHGDSAPRRCYICDEPRSLKEAPHV